jgi:hypothetical protein
MGDIGVHAFHPRGVRDESRTTELCADLSSIVAGRELDDRRRGVPALRQWRARTCFVASQICTGDENDLRLRGLRRRREPRVAASRSRTRCG